MAEGVGNIVGPVAAIGAVMLAGWALGFVAEKLGLPEAMRELFGEDDDQLDLFDPQAPCRCRTCRERPSEPCSDFDGP